MPACLAHVSTARASWIAAALVPWLCGHLAAAESFRPLFNGRNLNGWYLFLEGAEPGTDPERVVAVEDGMIHAYGHHEDGAKVPMGYIGTDEVFGDYHLRVRYRWGRKQFQPRHALKPDSGIYYHHASADRVWPDAMQFQVELNGVGDMITVGGIAFDTTVDPRTLTAKWQRYLPAQDGGQAYTTTGTGVTYTRAGTNHERDDWNTVDLICRGDEAVHLVNGHVVNRCRGIRRRSHDDPEEWLPLTAGRILLELEATEIFFKDVEIRPLDPQQSIDDAAGASATRAERTDDRPTATATAEPHQPLVKAEIAPHGDFKPPPIAVPEGYTLELAAAPPLVKHPMLAAFDDKGRLFVAESDGRNLRKDELLAERPRFIRMLVDSDGDGRYDKGTIFADDMVMPEGALWHDGSLYVVSAPYLWRLDTDGDGVADRREKLVGSFDFNGNPNLTGPTLGPDGRIYFAGGYFGYDLVDAAGKRHGTNGAAGVFSCRPDGSDLEIVGQGPLNPVEVLFLPEGDLLTTNAIFDNDGGRHDALVHWTDGCLTTQVYGRPLLPDTGWRIPAVCRWGQVAPAGLMQVRSDAAGDLTGSLLACQFNTNRVVRIDLVSHGATFRPVRDEVFLRGESGDFHPTDVLEDADGSLLVIDTGGWVYYGCPTSKLAKPNVLGAIYRLRRKGEVRPADPRGRELDWAAAPAAMAVHLDDPRPAVRDRAGAVLSSAGDPALPALEAVVKKAASVRARTNAVWAAARIGSPTALAVLRSALADSDDSPRQAAIHGLGRSADAAAVGQLADLLADGSPPTRLAVAVALGRIGDSRAVPALLAALARDDNDDHLRHALVRALIRINAAEPTRLGLSHVASRVQQGALVALDRMAGGGLNPEQTLPLLDSADALLVGAVTEVIGGHPEWGSAIRGVLERLLAEPAPGPKDAALAEAIIRSFARDAGVVSLLADMLAAEQTPGGTRVLALRGLAASDLPTLPDAVAQSLARLLEVGRGDEIRQAVDLISRKDAVGLDEPLAALVRRDGIDDALRLAALGILARHARPLDAEQFEFLRRRLDDDALAVDRMRAAEALAAASLTTEQSLAVVDLLRRAGPLEVPLLLRRFERDSAPRVVNVDVQGEAGRLRRGVAAFADEPEGPLAVWNVWNPSAAAAAQTALSLRASDGSFSGIMLGPVTGGPLEAGQSASDDPLLDDFVFNGRGGGEHRAFGNGFLISGLDLTAAYTLFIHASGRVNGSPHGAHVRVEDRGGTVSANSRGRATREEPPLEGVTYVRFSGLRPRTDGTLAVSWTAADGDVAGNRGVLNGLTLVAPPRPEGCDERVGLAVAEALAVNVAAAGIPPERLRRLFARYPDGVATAAEPLLGRLAATQRQRAERLETLLPAMSGGDPERGRAVFFGGRAACATCHRVLGAGAEVGPNLSSIGSIRRTRDLLESILYPSSTIVNGFERYVVVDNQGRSIDGLIGRETVDAVYLRRQGAEDACLPRANIELMEPQPISLMPEGLDKQMTTEQLRDLVAYLESLR